MSTQIKAFFNYNSSKFRLTIFWVCFFLYYYLTSDITYYEAGYIQMFESVFIIIFAKFILATITLNILVPNFLEKDKPVHFVLWLVLVLFLVYVLYFLARSSYYETKYFDYYPLIKQELFQIPFVNRIFDISAFLSKSLKFITPAAILLKYRFYKKQQNLLKLKEQKTTAELTVLKQQLNPHFLFNTLNNLYALTIKKSDQAPLIIEKLSNMLDYMLYRCDERFVSINKEVELIENYLVLEKLRYGNRVHINFENKLKENVSIAPLIMLTFIENAFKHGVAQELNQATINISLINTKENVVFVVENTKPNNIVEKEDKQSIGLTNVKKQLELLYPEKYELSIVNKAKKYQTILKLALK
ncbi:Histidine kinase [Tenacibaculum sp. MAR_2009_124]|uniref:sensor histidine kinase n=1 Tax=Tenacibaculum sp. MAR_2009_124 TaxID=1250059 RepID=UPI000895CE25|nr:histidine kinase [Tenacibaculum sp. MAR_2009_124]SEB39272.1 Histidine kinase [Tenacibaculum sp. MAR_2009_124]